MGNFAMHMRPLDLTDPASGSGAYRSRNKAGRELKWRKNSELN